MTEMMEEGIFFFFKYPRGDRGENLFVYCCSKLSSQNMISNGFTSYIQGTMHCQPFLNSTSAKNAFGQKVRCHDFTAAKCPMLPFVYLQFPSLGSPNNDTQDLL